MLSSNKKKAVFDNHQLIKVPPKRMRSMDKEDYRKKTNSMYYDKKDSND